MGSLARRELFTKLFSGSNDTHIHLATDDASDMDRIAAVLHEANELYFGKQTNAAAIAPMAFALAAMAPVNDDNSHEAKSRTQLSRRAFIGGSVATAVLAYSGTASAENQQALSADISDNVLRDYILPTKKSSIGAVRAKMIVPAMPAPAASARLGIKAGDPYSKYLRGFFLQNNLRAPDITELNRTLLNDQVISFTDGYETRFGVNDPVAVQRPKLVELIQRASKLTGRDHELERVIAAIDDPAVKSPLFR